MQQGTAHRTLAADTGCPQGRDKGPFVGERECFDSSCTGQAGQTGNQLDDGVACGLFADKADRDADIGQGAGEFEQPRGDKAGEQERFDPVKVTGHPRCEVTQHGEQAHDALPNGGETSGELAGIEFGKEVFQRAPDDRLDEFVPLHEGFRKLGGHLVPQAFGRVLLDLRQFGGDALRRPVLGSKRPKLPVVADKHHGGVASDFAEDGLHVGHRRPFLVQVLEDVGQRAQLFHLLAVDVFHAGEFHTQTVQCLPRLFGGFGKAGGHSSQSRTGHCSFDTHIAEHADGGGCFRKSTPDRRR